MSLRVYAYRGCDTCRKALKFLAERKVPHEVVPIREQPPTVEELRRMLAHLGGDVRRLFNTSGGDYRAMNLKEKLPTLAVDEALTLLSSNGNLVKRPFALGESGGAVGFRLAEWQTLVG
ncbi:MAG: arsenate reductase family protein [Chthoniobacteraceae bacterium]